MPRKKKPPLSFIQKMKALSESGISNSPILGSRDNDDTLQSLESRVDKILGLSDNVKKRKDRMLFFVMYDIENDKVRRLVVRYLQKLGCTRIQKSIFLAEGPVAVYNRIKDELSEVQTVYENQDSIIVLPITTDYLRMMKIIGREVNLDIVTKTKSTLFF